MADEYESKVLMIGIDAGDIDFIQSSLDRLPRLRQLFAAREPWRLGSEAAALSSSVWPTFSTGKMPGEHGIYYPMQWDAAEMKLRRVGVDWLAYEPFWAELARHGKRVTVLDVPFSLPSGTEQVTELLNWGSQECLGPIQSNRAELAREARRRFGSHPMGQDVPVAQTPAQLARARDDLARGARVKAELSRWLMDAADWDLFITVFAECHRGGHLLWPGPADVPADALCEVYQAVDEAIGHVLDGVDLATTTVIVFSVHGMTANYTQEHHLLPVLERINAGFRGESIDQTEPAAGGLNPIRALRALVPGQAQQLAAAVLPDGVRDWVVRRTYHGGLNWSETPAFAVVASCEGYLRYNRLEREAEGMLEVNSAQHARYSQWLHDNLFALEETGTRRRLVKDVVSAPDLYPGPRSGNLPDLIVVWDDLLPASEIESSELGSFSGRHATGRTGDHQPTGFAVVAGDSRRLDRAPPLRHTADFAEFVYSLLMHPVDA